MSTVTEESRRGPSLTVPDSNAAPTARVRLTAHESAITQALVEEALVEVAALDPTERLLALAVRAHELPKTLRTALVDFSVTGRPYGGFVISGLPIDERVAGPTPTTYSTEPQSHEAEKAGALLVMVGSVLGHPFSYLTQQNGRLVLDVYPVRGHEEAQLGSSSTITLDWHNEDAFHPCRADWIMLLCIRNHDRVATTFAPVQDLTMSQETREVLFQDRFIILPDESHTAQFNSDTTGYDEHDPKVRTAFEQVRAMSTTPQRLPILTGDTQAPYVRIDPAFMQRDLQDPVAEQALDEVIDAFDGHLRDIVLEPGDMLIIDNFRAVHGRKPFAARYDGTDRWLRRINVSSDLRKSAGRRFGDHGRAVI